MIKDKISIPIYDWTIHYVEAQSVDDAVNVYAFLRKYCKDEIIDTIRKEIEDGAVNGGWHLATAGSFQSYIVIYPHDKRMSVTNTIMHEMRHAVDYLLDFKSVKDAESAAMLSGYVGGKLHKFMR